MRVPKLGIVTLHGIPEAQLRGAARRLLQQADPARSPDHLLMP